MLSEIPHLVASVPYRPIRTEEETIAIVSARGPLINRIEVHEYLVVTGHAESLVFSQGIASAQQVSEAIRHSVGVLDEALLFS